MGLTALIVQTYAGDIIDKTRFDRRLILGFAALLTSVSAMAILFVPDDGSNTGHAMIYITKIIEGIASSFIGPSLAALTLACFGPYQFDSIMASNTLWSHIGSSISAVLAGLAAYAFYPQIKNCFYVIGVSGILAIFFIQFLPEGDPLMGRGFQSQSSASTLYDVDSNEKIENTSKDNILSKESNIILYSKSTDEMDINVPEATSYMKVFSDSKTLILCLTGFFFQ